MVEVEVNETERIDTTIEEATITTAVVEIDIIILNNINDHGEILLVMYWNQSYWDVLLLLTLYSTKYSTC